MPEAAESGAALNFSDWAQEGVDGLKRIYDQIVCIWRILFGQIWSLVARDVGSTLLGARQGYCLDKMYTTVKLVVLVLARLCLIYVVYIYVLLIAMGSAWWQVTSFSCTCG